MTSPRLVLHIGTPKTATTAIQRFLYDNYNVFLENGILYPRSVIHNETVHYPVNWAIEDDDSGVRESLTREIKKNNPNTVIISSELFTAPRFHSILALGKTVDFIKACGIKISDVSVVVYFRRQDQFYESIYNEMVKNHSWSKQVHDTSAFLDYYYLLKLWAQFFPKKNIIVRAYEKRQFKNDIFEDFISAIGMPYDSRYEKPQADPNPRLSPQMLELMRITNTIRMSPGERDKFNKYLIQIATKMLPSKTKSQAGLLSNSERHEILEMYERINAAVASEFMGRDDGKLFYDEIDDSRAGNQEMLVTKGNLAQIIVEQWRNNVL